MGAGRLHSAACDVRGDVSGGRPEQAELNHQLQGAPDRTQGKAKRPSDRMSRPATRREDVPVDPLGVEVEPERGQPGHGIGQASAHPAHTPDSSNQPDRDCCAGRSLYGAA